MTLKERAHRVSEAIDKLYPQETKCFLDYKEPWQLLIATILSAQCTDYMVNIVTKDLFAKYPTLIALAESDPTELEACVKPTGFYRNKAKNIRMAAAEIITRFDGILPDNMQDLLTLPGVGRKTANVILTHIFNVPSIVVDTHVKRISARLGLTKNTDPTKIEFDLMKILDKQYWSRYNTQIISFGREICRSQNPKCDECLMKEYCVKPIAKKKLI